MSESLAKSTDGSVRKNLTGQGGKVLSMEMEECLMDWITEMRAKGNRVSRNMIKAKAKELFPQIDDATKTTFAASSGWLSGFMDRNGLSVRRVTSVAQKPPNEFADKIVSHIMFTAQLRKNHRISDDRIIAMDETAVFFDMTSNSTVEKSGVKTVSVRSTGHEKALVTVVLAAKGNGEKLKPFIVFKQAVREVKAMQSINGVKIISTKNGWMNEDTTCEWLDSVLGKLNFGKRILVWDSYRCHISENTKKHIKKFNVLASVVPGGCTKFIQAPDVSWNKPFKDRIRSFYDEWLASDQDKEFTTGGNLKAPNKRLIVEWVLKSWNELPKELISRSFKSVGLTVSLDGSEDNLIHCMKENQPCRCAWDILQNFRLQCDEADREFGLLEIEDEEQL